MIKYECKNLVMTAIMLQCPQPVKKSWIWLWRILWMPMRICSELTPEQADDLNTKLEFLTKNSEVEEIVSDADEGDDEIFGFDDEDDDDEFEELKMKTKTKMNLTMKTSLRMKMTKKNSLS